jgi:hypothetical protein
VEVLQLHLEQRDPAARGSQAFIGFAGEMVDRIQKM